MGKRDERVDAYIRKSGEFAKPILTRLRKLVHEGCPDVEETIKWGMPSFDYKGPFCGMAAFKQHAVFGFWKSKLLKDPGGYLGERSAQGGEAMGNLGRLTALKDLPPDKVILAFLQQAKILNDDGVKLPAKPKGPKIPLKVPAYLKTALSKSKKAQAAWDDFSYSHKKEYIEWLTEAKTEETRNSRLATAIEWIAGGKSRNWKYARK
ncbi:MAG TPA: YdeI/OmpD-associated family protein [Bacteroidota bacterium]|jgi:uncharacterized protein YdeI (YjbR/CyaY-like superfamily)|nr:YdeI/OmpD-associated family protein [Bacteroidota bacterium]